MLEKYIITRVPVVKEWARILSETTIPQGAWSVSRRIGNRRFQYHPDEGWTEEKKRINPAWRSEVSYVGVYGEVLPAVLTHIVVRVPNPLLRCQRKLRGVISKILKHLGGLSKAPSAGWNYLGVLDGFEGEDTAKFFTVNHDWTWQEFTEQQ